MVGMEEMVSQNRKRQRSKRELDNPEISGLERAVGRCIMTEEDMIGTIVGEHMKDHNLDDEDFKNDLVDEVIDKLNEHILHAIERHLRNEQPLRKAVREAIAK